MKNKKFFICLVFFVLNIVLIDNLVLSINQKNSNIYFPNFSKKQESSASNSRNLLLSQPSEGNQTNIDEFSISNSIGEIELISGVYTSYNGGNITVEFKIIDLDFNNESIFDIYNQATYLIRYEQIAGSQENGILSSQISYNNNTHKYSGDIETSILLEGDYRIIMDIDLLNYAFDPYNYNLTLKTLLALQMGSISNHQGRIIRDSNNRYNIDLECNISVMFDLFEMDFNISKVLDENISAIYQVNYFKANDMRVNGTLENSIRFEKRHRQYPYRGNIKTFILPAELYKIEINITLYSYTFVLYRFFLQVNNYFRLEMISISHVHGVIEYDSNSIYNTYPEVNITVNFKLLDMRCNIIEVMDNYSQGIYLTSYYNVANNKIIGSLFQHIEFNTTSETYSGIIETYYLPEETYYIEINATLLNYTFESYRFKLRVRRYVKIEMYSISDPGGILTPSENLYTIFMGSVITVNFTLLSMDINISEVLDVNNTAIYQNTHKLVSNISYNNGYYGILNTSVLSLGIYTIKINITIFNKTTDPYSLKLQVIKKLDVLISIFTPSEITVGDKFTVYVLAIYNDEMDSAEGVPIKFTLYINDVVFVTFKLITDSNGYAGFEYYLPMKTEKLTVVAEVVYSHIYKGFLINSGISVISNLEIVLSLIFIIGLITFSIIISISMYNRFISPKKREKTRNIHRYMQTFEDISLIDSIFILFRRNGKIIFHKSYISKKINQEKIAKYVSLLSITKYPIKSQELLNETTYEGKTLLLADGKHVRASLVLNKVGSMFLKNNLKEFIYSFEYKYENVLDTLQDNLIPNKEIEKLLEDKLNIFIILPYKIEDENLNKKLFLKPDFNDLLSLATNLIKETGKSFFFVSALLKKFVKQSNKGIAKFFKTFKELRNNEVFSSINVFDQLKEFKVRTKLQREYNNQKLYNYIRQFAGRNNQVLLSIILPVFNEEKTIYSILKNLPKNELIEIIVVDDHSTDKSISEIERMRKEIDIKFIKLPQNMGYGGALITGVNVAKSGVIITMDSDGQHKPSDILSLIKPVFEGEADLTIGSRYLGTNYYNLPLITRIGEALIEKLIQIFFGPKIMNNQNGFRAFNKNISPLFFETTFKDFSVPTELILLTSINGYKIKECPVDLYHRQFGSSKVKLSKLTLHLLSCIMIQYMKKIFKLGFKKKKS